jgi:hypothetical protein
VTKFKSVDIVLPVIYPGKRREDMTLTRWKLLAGLLGLSMGGVVAIAEPPCRTIAANPTCPAPVTVVGHPVVVGSPIVERTTAKSLPAQALKSEPVAAPVMDSNSSTSTLPTPVELPPHVPDMPKATTNDGTATPSLSPAVVPITCTEPILPMPVVTDVDVNPNTAAISGPNPLQRLDPPAVPKQTPPESMQSTTLSGTTRVVLNIGAGAPRFEILSGDDTLLKVVCDKVEVTSPSEQGEVMSALKATGAVRFCAPGCVGICNELMVLPGVGDVELSGDVRVKCKQGKGETEIVAAKMTFKLGSAPGYTVPEPTVTVPHFSPSARR